MTNKRNSLESVLNEALVKELNHFQFYYDGVRNLEHPAVKNLFAYLVESQGDVVDRIELMLTSGKLEPVADEDVLKYLEEEPNVTPFNPARAEEDESIAAVNEALEIEYESYKMFKDLAERVPKKGIRLMFLSYAGLKGQRIDWIRNVFDGL